jgi:3-hydroxyisobutyrate dehydrogenase
VSGDTTRDARVGFIGVGHMGKHMAASLIRDGFDLVVHDKRAEAASEPEVQGASWAESPAEVARLSRTVFMSLPGPAQVEQVVLGEDGTLAGSRPGDVYVDMSTSTPACIRGIADTVRSRGVRVADAPVAGGMRGARKGTLTIMVGADREIFDIVRPYLDAMGEHIVRVGDVGAGHAAKLVNNMMTIGNGIIAMEAMVFGAKAGLDLEVLLDVVRAGTGDSYSLNAFPYVIFKGNFDPPKFALSLAAKDLRISAESAASLGVHLSVVPFIEQAMVNAVDQGLGERDWTSYITLLEEQAGVVVRVPESDRDDGSNRQPGPDA